MTQVIKEVDKSIFATTGVTVSEIEKFGMKEKIRKPKVLKFHVIKLWKLNQEKKFSST